MSNLCESCFRIICMLHPDNSAEGLGHIKFRMIECQNHLTDVSEEEETFADKHNPLKHGYIWCPECVDKRERSLGTDGRGGKCQECNGTGFVKQSVPTGDLSVHLTAIRKMVEESLEEKQDMRDTLAEIVYLIITDPDYQFAMGEMGQMLYKHKDVLERNDISFE